MVIHQFSHSCYGRSGGNRGGPPILDLRKWPPLDHPFRTKLVKNKVRTTHEMLNLD